MKQYKESKNRVVYNIDFDGTITTGEYTDNPGANDPVINRVKELYMTGNIIIIWTARLWSEAPFMIAWLIKNSVPFHGIMMGKGGSCCYVDDKAVSIEEFVK